MSDGFAFQFSVTEAVSIAYLLYSVDLRRNTVPHTCIAFYRNRYPSATGSQDIHCEDLPGRKANINCGSDFKVGIEHVLLISTDFTIFWNHS
jgi:hypothetical protein